MELILRKAVIEEVQICSETMLGSEIYEKYYGSILVLNKMIVNAIEKNELYAAVNSSQEILGIMKVVPKGFCGIYHYLALLSVASWAQQGGVGTFLLKEFETMAQKEGSRKSALLVSDFNKNAQSYYTHKGYNRIGLIPNAVKDGIGEYLMIKDLV